jgi:hypothetical protein
MILLKTKSPINKSLIASACVAASMVFAINGATAATLQNAHNSYRAPAHVVSHVARPTTQPMPVHTASRWTAPQSSYGFLAGARPVVGCHPNTRRSFKTRCATNLRRAPIRPLPNRRLTATPNLSTMVPPLRQARRLPRTRSRWLPRRRLHKYKTMRLMQRRALASTAANDSRAA